MRTYERSWWLVKEKKMALVFMTVMMILQLQMKRCVGCVATERMGLLQLKSYFDSLRSPSKESILDSWSGDDLTSNCCSWEKIKCSDTIGGHIVDLSLYSLNNLDLPQSRGFNLSLLHSFPHLKTLDISFNSFDHLFSPIHGHKSLQRLANLETLNMSSNHFNNNVIPFLSGARSLRNLNLGHNRLKGFISPNGMVFFPSLRVLDLKHNHLSSTQKGYLNLCGLMNLQELDLSYNVLTSMPDCLGNLSRLRTLDLSNNQFTKDLSSFVSGLPSTLEYLSLLDNKFNGSFLFNSLANQTKLRVFKLSSEDGTIQVQAESSWVPLFQLKILKLQNFILGGTIPRFLVYQHDLCLIDLSHNELTGAFPAWLVQNNTRLQTILLNNNSLTKLQLPRFVHGLQVLDISSNKIHGSIQEDLGIVFPKLMYMKFSSNQFHGTIPSSMGGMKSLYVLDVSSNGLSGQLPKPFLSGCYSLESLVLSNNQFHGEIFPEHANLTGLGRVFLDGNKFNGSLGKGLLNSKGLLVLDISNNSLFGRLPLWISRMSKIQYLYMRENQLKGPFPHLLHSHWLKVMDISNNSFSGLIPRSVTFPYLIELRLQNNEFMGSIPDTLFKSEQLEVLDFRNNNFSGKILNNMSKRSNLHVLLLRNNSLKSHIPEKICQLSKISILDLSHNNFKGPIPPCLGNMDFGARGYEPYDSISPISVSTLVEQCDYTSAIQLNFDMDYFSQGKPETLVDLLTKSRYEAYQGGILGSMSGLDLSSNELSGPIPFEIGNLQNIRSLNLSSNNLTGSIPDSISRLEDLESLDLSNNKLDGNIPPVLVDLNSLGYFNVSCNNLSGEIPFKAHLVTFNERSYIGNTHLCGLPTSISCNPVRVPEPSASLHDKEEEDGVIDMVWFYWTCGAVYISTSLALFTVLCIDSRWSREWFYRVDIFINHLQRYKHSSFFN